MAELWRDDDLAQHFVALTALLLEGQQFWRPHAFKYLQLPWEADFPELSTQLRALSYEVAEQLARDDKLLTGFFRMRLPVLSALDRACAIGNFDAECLPQDVAPYNVPGRKWQQIRRFAPCIAENNFAVLEWCSGKAHLGRALAKQRGSVVTALEYDARLIAAGQTQAARENIAIDFRCVDVMTVAVVDVLQKDCNAVALHACGDLHMRLLTLCAQIQTQTITLAPCCYQLITDECHYVLSQAAHACGLQLQRDDLRTAVHGTVTAAPRQNRLRRQLQAWRLGFDLLQRKFLETDTYLSTPALSTAILRTSFANFCSKLALHHHLQLPDCIDYSHYERAGYERLREVTALDLPRIAYRRALELWLVLDRALFLREQGYAVTVGVFCERALTPRNILIRAQHLNLASA